MRLYTEEQVREILKSTHIHTDNDVDMILPQFTPIELPTNEEIEKEADNTYVKYNAYAIEGFIDGAKWYREQLKQRQ